MPIGKFLRRLSVRLACLRSSRRRVNVLFECTKSVARVTLSKRSGKSAGKNGHSPKRR